MASLVFKTSDLLIASGGFDSHPPPPAQNPLRNAAILAFKNLVFPRIDTLKY